MFTQEHISRKQSNEPETMVSSIYSVYNIETQKVPIYNIRIVWLFVQTINRNNTILL